MSQSGRHFFDAQVLPRLFDAPSDKKPVAVTILNLVGQKSLYPNCACEHRIC